MHVRTDHSRITLTLRDTSTKAKEANLDRWQTPVPQIQRLLQRGASEPYCAHHRWGACVAGKPWIAPGREDEALWVVAQGH